MGDLGEKPCQRYAHRYHRVVEQGKTRLQQVLCEIRRRHLQSNLVHHRHIAARGTEDVDEAANKHTCDPPVSEGGLAV